MNSAHDRRAPGTARMPFDAMVEVGGALGPSFEAQAVNLSEEGMSLRTAYLPEVGQPVMCRFDAGAGPGMTVVAAGEVLWKDDMGDGGEFGIRFTNLDAPSTVALQRILGMAEDGQLQQMDPHGRKVRLHIEGLASPMRARIKDQTTGGVMAYSELGFLQMGKPLELEDAVSGARRPAMIDRVEVEVNGESRIPQLVVSLRYDDTDGRNAVAMNMNMNMNPGGSDVGADDGGGGMGGHTPQDPAGEMDDMDNMHDNHNNAMPPTQHEAVAADAKSTMISKEHGGAGGEDGMDDEESNKLKGAFARNAAKVTPALMAWAKRAKTTAALLAAKARKGSAKADDELDIPVRRTTAPAPNGGLHASGRKVTRGSISEVHFDSDEIPSPKPAGGRFNITRKKAAIGGTVAVAIVLIFIAMRKPAPAPQLANAPPGDGSGMAANGTAPNMTPGPNGKPISPPNDPLAAAAAAMHGGSKGGKAIPFTNGPVGAHPVVIKVKMDGNIDGIQGATQPTGFTIVTPNRKSMDPTNTLADKDPRIQGLVVANDAPGGAEFVVTFRDGVPNYLVRAHGDTLEMVLAAPSAHGDKAEASAKKKGGKHHKKK